MFTVEGFLPDGGPYAVQVGSGRGAALGDVVGDDAALALLSTYEGQTLNVTPTGPLATLSLADPASVLAALYALTTVTGVRGDAPDVFGPSPRGVVH